MSLCDEAKARGNEKYHRWDAQKALAKGGVEDGDLCDCGEVRFGMTRESDLEHFRRKYHEAMDILSAVDKIDHAHAVAQLLEAQKELERQRERAAKAWARLTEREPPECGKCGSSMRTETWSCPDCGP